MSTGDRSSPVLSVTEAAVKFGVSERCIRKWLHAGRLQGTLVGKQWCVDVGAGEPGDLPFAGSGQEHNGGPEAGASAGSGIGARSAGVQGGRLPPVPLPGHPSCANEVGRFHVQSLKTWEAARSVLGPLMTDLDSPAPLKRRLAEQAVLVFEELCRGYHAYHYRDKVGHYHGARDALCSVAALAALAEEERLSEAVQGEPLSSAAALIRSIEKKGRKRDGA